MQLRRGVLEQALEHLRLCGDGRRECIVYLTGPLDAPELIDGVIHPSHTATAGHYEVDTAAIGELFKDLLATRRSVRAQLHSHPHEAYHSPRDDAHPLVSTPGYLSAVVADFARGPVDLDAIFVAERTANGGWAPVLPSERLQVIP